MTDPTEPCESPPTDGAEVEVKLKELGILDSTETSLQPADKLLALLADKSKSETVLKSLFPAGIQPNSSFYGVLDEVWRCLGIGEKTDKAVGQLWAKAAQQLDASGGELLLNAFTIEKAHDLFLLLGSLRHVLRLVNLSTDFLVTWLPKLFLRVEKDFAQYDFWSAVHDICLKSASQTLELIHRLLARSDSAANQLATVFMGLLRGVQLTEPERDEFGRIEESLEVSANPAHQSCLIWSWVTTAREHGLTIAQLDRLLAFGGEHSEHDADQKLSAICRLLSVERLDQGVFDKAFNWASGRISNEVSRTAKFHVANTVVALQRLIKNKTPPALEGRKPAAWSGWAVDIQPVQGEDAGTWECIESYLVELVAADGRLFSEVFGDLVTKNGDGVLQVMDRPHGFGRLRQEMASARIENLIANMMLSPSRPSRRVGLKLFAELGHDALDKNVVANCDERSIKLVFYELQRSLPNPLTTARMFVSLLPRAQAIGGDFFSEFTNEMALQVRNYSHGCREELTRLGGDVPLVKKILADAERHFEELRTARESPIRAIHVPGTRRAVVLHSRRMSRQISAGIEERSVIMKMVKKVHLLYGRASSSYFDGNLRTPMPLVPQSSSLELPFVDYCDPEDMCLRRLYASAAIAALEQ